MNWSAAEESSRAVSICRAAAARSVVVSSLHRLLVRVRSASQPLRPDVQSAALRSDFDVIPRVAGDSAVVRILARLVEGGSIDWRRSSAAVWGAGLVDAWRRLDLAPRVRLAALTLFVAVGVHVTMTGFSAPVPTPRARFTWIFVLAALAAAIGAAPAVAAAWTDWRRRWTAPQGKSDIE